MDNSFTLILNSIATIVSFTALIITIVFNKKQREEFYNNKNIDTYISISSRNDVFIGSLQAHGITIDNLKSDNLSIEQVMYYSSLLNTLWIRNTTYDKKFKKIKLLLSKDDYNGAYLLAREINTKHSLIYKGGQTAKILKTDSFVRAWKYLENFWSDNSIVRLIVNITIEENTAL